MKYSLRIALILITSVFSNNVPTLYARPVKNILNSLGPVMPGECSEKSLRYKGYALTTRFFYPEDDYIEEIIDEKTTALRLPENVKTPEQARERFERNKAAFADLIGWRISFEDFCRKGSLRRDFAIADICAKLLLIEELWSEKYQKLAPEIAREQFEMGIHLLVDLYSEYEGLGVGKRRYGKIMDLYRNDPDTDSGFEYNLAGEMAFFLYFRQYRLQRMSGEDLWIKFRDGLILYYADDPKTLWTSYAWIPHRLSFQWSPRQNKATSSSKDDRLAELETFLLYGPNKKVIPITPQCRKAIENLKEYRKTLPDPPHGSAGGM